jgi:CheY-like chemotaxis protein
MSAILIIEDNAMNREMLSRRLERRGYTVLLASDGQTGIEVARANTPDLVLMDMSLPVMDGWQATRLMKKDALLMHIPIIALTAHAMADDRHKALEAGCNDYDTKPIELPRLLAKIEALLLAPVAEGT